MRRDRPFVLSDIQSLTEVNYYMSSLYSHLYPTVNKKGVSFFAHFKTSVLLALTKLQYIVSFQFTVRMMNIIINNPSNKELSAIISTYLYNKYPKLSQKGERSLIKLLYFHDELDAINTSNQDLQILFSCNKRNAQKITQELVNYGLITKNLSSNNEGIYCDLQNALRLSINISGISGIKFKQTEFLATYVKTEPLYIKGTTFKKALFQNVHDLDNIITIKTYEIGYDDDTSNFLKKLNAGDVISFTPSINKPTFKGIKHPLNLKIHTKAETEEDMTFFATFDCIEEKIVNGHGLRREARFKEIHNINGNIRQKYTWTDIEPNTHNTLAIAKMDEGQEVVFKATVIPGDKGFYFKNIHNIMHKRKTQ